MDSHRTTRRPDGKPEAPADTRFFSLRESGYRGPIDQDGRPADTPSAAAEVTRPEGSATGRSCPGCGEPAVHRPPADLNPWQAHGQDRPEWSHADGNALCPVIGPGGYQPASPVPAHAAPASARGLGQPATDAEFLDSCDQLASQLSDLAVQVTDWAEGLADLHLPRPVLAPLHDAVGLLAGAAVQVIQASQAFRAQFGSAREAAARGLRITGDPS